MRASGRLAAASGNFFKDFHALPAVPESPFPAAPLAMPHAQPPLPRVATALDRVLTTPWVPRPGSAGQDRHKQPRDESRPAPCRPGARPARAAPCAPRSPHLPDKATACTEMDGPALPRKLRSSVAHPLPADGLARLGSVPACGQRTVAGSIQPRPCDSDPTVPTPCSRPPAAPGAPWSALPTPDRPTAGRARSSSAPDLAGGQDGHPARLISVPRRRAIRWARPFRPPDATAGAPKTSASIGPKSLSGSAARSVR